VQETEDKRKIRKGVRQVGMVVVGLLGDANLVSSRDVFLLTFLLLTFI